MRYYQIFITLILFGINIVSGQEAWTNKSRILPDRLRKIPVEIFIQHSPNPNYPEINDTEKNENLKYVWKHSTTITSPNMNLEIIEAGSYIWYDSSGWKKNVVLTKKEFKKKFQCPEGKLKKDTNYTFEKNFRWGSSLYGGDALWYVLAKDKSGNIYKGIGILETESELQN